MVVEKSWQIRPKDATFFADDSCQESVHHLLNASVVRYAFKVKSSNNQLYRFKPVYSTVEPGEEVMLTIIKRAERATPDVVDRVCVHVSRLNEEEKPKDAFERTGSEGQIEMKILLTDSPVQIHPADADFFLGSNDKPVQSEHHLHNSSDKRLAIKVKCSDNSQFRISPVYGILEPKAELALVVTRKPVAKKREKEKAVLQITEAREDMGAVQAFQENDQVVKETKMDFCVHDSLTVEIAPAEATFKRPFDKKIVLSYHSVSNVASGQRFAVKVMCSNNDCFRVRPVYFLLNPASVVFCCLTLVPEKLPTKDERHLLLLQFLELDPGEEPSDVRAAFKSTKKKISEKKLVIFLR